jgi:hypothetical protein
MEAFGLVDSGDTSVGHNGSVMCWLAGNERNALLMRMNLIKTQ